MFLMSSLAAIGTGLLLSKKGNAFNKRESVTIIHIGDFHHEARSLVSMEWVQKQYYNSTMKRRWIPKEYLCDMDCDLELATSQGGRLAFITSKEEQRGYKIFIDMKDGGKYMQEFGFDGLTGKRKYIHFVLFGATS
jgi:hypothetical protein